MVQNAREQLEASLPGTEGGRNPKDALLVKFLFLLPLLALLFCYYRPFLQVSSSIFFFGTKQIDLCLLILKSIPIFLQTREIFGSFCRKTLYDPLRHLYYKFRSGGSLPYSTVSSTSTINSNQQVSFWLLTVVHGYV